MENGPGVQIKVSKVQWEQCSGLQYMYGKQQVWGTTDNAPRGQCTMDLGDNRLWGKQAWWSMNNEWASGTMDLRDSRQWTWGAMDLRDNRHGGQWTTDLGDSNVWYLYTVFQSQFS